MASFSTYQPEGVRGEMMIDNLLLKLQTEEFCTDINAMARIDAPAYDPQAAGKMVIEQLLSNIE